MKQISKIVLTGGPCSGKSTALSTIEQTLGNRGYYVLTIPETATELIPNGIRPFDNSLDKLTFQDILFEKQLHKETLYEKVAKLLPAKKVVILHDRALIDSKDYISSEEFSQLLSHFSTNELAVRERYDAVFHLVTTANGAEEFYTLDNNKARSETLDDARALDKRNIASWTGHPHFRVIDNSTDFQTKITRLVNEVYSYLGDPIPIAIERKYLVSKPDLSVFSQYVDTTEIDILQTYLPSVKNVERRVRKRSQYGYSTYYLTEKHRITCNKNVKIERKISQKEYMHYLSEQVSQLLPITKKRICFVYNFQYFELDLFDFPSDFALLEIKLTNTNSSVSLPPFIHVLKDVTDNSSYRNYNIAQMQQL